MRTPTACSAVCLAGLLPALLAAGPAGAVVDGDLLAVVGGAGPQMVSIPPATGVPEILASGGLLVTPRDVVWLPRTGRLLVVDADAGPGGSGAVIEIEPAAQDAGQPGAD